MQKEIRHSVKCRRAFTLVELILVVGTIGMVTGALVGVIGNSTKDYEFGSDRSTLFQDGQAVLDQMVRTLRQAKAFSGVTASTNQAGYITYTSADDVTEQFKLNTQTGELEYGQPASLSALTGNVSSLTFTCYDTDAVALTGAVQPASIKSVQIAMTLTGTQNTVTLTGRVYCQVDHPIITSGPACSIADSCRVGQPVGWWTLDEIVLYYPPTTASTSHGNIWPEYRDNAQQTGYWSAGYIPTAQAPAWIQLQYDSGGAHVVTEYSVQILNYVNAPDDWNILGSNDDGANWVTLDTVTNHIWLKAAAVEAFSFSNSTAYNIYRMEVTKMPDTWQLDLQQVTFYTQDRVSLVLDSSGNENRGLLIGEPVTVETTQPPGTFTVSNGSLSSIGRWDGTITNGWAWIQLQYDSEQAYVVNKYQMKNGSESLSPKDWTLSGSNNGSTWTLLHTKTGYNFTGGYQTHNFQISNSTAFKTYRIVITKVKGGGSRVMLNHLKFFTETVSLVVDAGLPVIAEGHIGNALSLDGADDYVAIPGPTIEGNTFSVIAWIKTDGTQGNWAGIFRYRPGRTNTTGGHNFGLHILSNNEIRYNWDDKPYMFSPQLYVPMDRWSLVACVVEPDSATLYLYDGTTLRSGVYLGTHSVQTLIGGEIGADYGIDESQRYFKGLMDDLRIHDIALNDAEITALCLGWKEGAMD